MSSSPSPDHHREVSQKQLEWWERELILAHSFKGNSHPDGDVRQGSLVNWSVGRAKLLTWMRGSAS